MTYRKDDAYHGILKYKINIIEKRLRVKLFQNMLQLYIYCYVCIIKRNRNIEHMNTNTIFQAHI